MRSRSKPIWSQVLTKTANFSSSQKCHKSHHWALPLKVACTSLSTKLLEASKWISKAIRSIPSIKSLTMSRNIWILTLCSIRRSLTRFRSQSWTLPWIKTQQWKNQFLTWTRLMSGKSKILLQMSRNPWRTSSHFNTLRIWRFHLWVRPFLRCYSKHKSTCRCNLSSKFSSRFSHNRLGNRTSLWCNNLCR